MSLVSDAVRSTRARAVLAVIVAWALFQLWLTLAAPGKISPELAGTSDKLNVQIELRGVKRTDLTSVARPYWVTAVGPIKPGG